MDYKLFEAAQDALQSPQVIKFGADFNQFSNDQLVDVFHALMKQLDVNCLLEFGAHRAPTSKRYLKANPSCKAVAIEANPFNFAKYSGSAISAGVLYLNYALTDKTGRLNLVLSDEEGDRKRGHTRTSNSILLNLRYGRTKEVEVPAITFDDLEKDPVYADYLAPLSSARKALWIDVEGALSQLLDGAQNALPKCLFAIAEVESVELYKGQKTVVHVVEQFAKLGFFPFVRDSEYMPKQYNIIFVNGALVAPESLTAIREKFEENIRNYQPA